MNVLFLDIDGVLNSRVTAEKHGSYCIHPILSERLMRSSKQQAATVLSRHIDSTKRRVAAYWRPVSYLTAVRLICPHRLAPLKLQRGGKCMLDLNTVFQLLQTL